MHSARALKRILRPIKQNAQEDLQRKTSSVRLIRKKGISPHYLKRKGVAAEVSLVREIKRKCDRKDAVPDHSPLTPIRQTRRSHVHRVDYKTLNDVGFVDQEIENSKVINKKQPLLNISRAGRKQYANLTRNPGYKFLQLKPGSEFIRKKTHPLYIGLHFLSPDLRCNGNNRKKEYKNRQIDEINNIVRQVDHYLASTANPNDPIYQRIRVRVVEKTPSIPASHPFLLEQQLGGYATAFMPRGTVLCHYAGILDFYENETPNAKLRNNYCLGLEDNVVHTSGKRQQLNGSAHSGGHRILVTSYDARGKWVGNAAGRINDPRGTRDKTNVAIQWIKVHPKDQPDLVVDMPFLITTGDVQPGEQLYFDYGQYFFTDPTESLGNPVSLDAPESHLTPRACLCGECGNGLFLRETGGIKRSVSDGTFQCCTSLGCDSEVLLRI